MRSEGEERRSNGSETGSRRGGGMTWPYLLDQAATKNTGQRSIRRTFHRGGSQDCKWADARPGSSSGVLGVAPLSPMQSKTASASLKSSSAVYLGEKVTHAAR